MKQYDIITFPECLNLTSHLLNHHFNSAYETMALKDTSEGELMTSIDLCYAVAIVRKTYCEWAQVQRRSRCVSISKLTRFSFLFGMNQNPI